MKSFIRSLFLVLLVLSALPIAPGHAQTLSLQQAQQALVDDINLKRRQLYRDIARKNNINLQAVEALAGKKAIENAGSGEMVQGNDGQWMKKP